MNGPLLLYTNIIPSGLQNNSVHHCTKYIIVVFSYTHICIINILYNTTINVLLYLCVCAIKTNTAALTGVHVEITENTAVCTALNDNMIRSSQCNGPPAKDNKDIRYRAAFWPVDRSPRRSPHGLARTWSRREWIMNENAVCHAMAYFVPRISFLFFLFFLFFHISRSNEQSIILLLYRSSNWQ